MKSLDKHNDKYKSFLKNKRVAIVGPSQSAFFNKNGKYIDSFDIVVRINRGIELVEGQESFLGSQTDVLYNSLDCDILSGGVLTGVDDQINFICCPYSVEEHTYNDAYIESLFDKFNIRFINTEVYNKLKLDTKSRINSGFGAIVDLLQHDIQQLFITGIDFYRSFYHPSYCKERNRSATVEDIEKELEFKQHDDENHHNPDRQYAYFKELVASDTRVIMDPFLNKIIEDSRYDSWDTIPRDQGDTL
jgi:hypothetical protein